MRRARGGDAPKPPLPRVSLRRGEQQGQADAPVEDERGAQEGCAGWRLRRNFHRLCLLDRRLIYRLLSWARYSASCAFTTGACCTVPCQARHPATCAFSTGACCAVSSQARHSAACASPAEAHCTVPSQARHSAACASPAGACCAVSSLLSLFVVGAQAYSYEVNDHHGAAKSWRARRASGG
jgi:hypothetical protein